MIDWRFVGRRAGWVLVLFPLSLWASLLVTFWSHPLGPGEFTDATAYHLAAESVREGGSPYSVIPPRGPHVVPGPLYLYPPPTAAFLSLFDLNQQETYRLFLLAGIIGYLGLSWGMARLAGRGWRVGLVLWTAMFVFVPARGMVWMGNVEPLTGALSVLALVAAPAVAAGLLATAAAIKVTPFWPLLVVLMRRPASAAAAVVVGIAAGIICVAGMGLQGSSDALLTWTRDVAPTLAQGQFWHHPDSWLTWNVSPAFAPVRLFLSDPGAGSELPYGARLYLTLMQFGVPLVTAWVTRRRDWREQAGWVLVAATLSAPIVRPGYLPILLVVPALLLRQRRARDSGQTADAWIRIDPIHPGSVTDSERGLPSDRE